MIYLDTSVVLAELFAEDKQVAESLWYEPLISSRLLEYELYNRINARKLSNSYSEAVRNILGRVSLVELSPVVLQRAIELFPVTIRTLDALHLATACYLRDHHQKITLATFDERMRNASTALGIELFCDS
ncbi:MAG: type II toxin-antitoxin system VapC family toxin [Deltaproteobacteria bacterium]|nr:type II toxin-antitoxin system VapC family toxin [Deltaproteobacteria bacterium]